MVILNNNVGNNNVGASLYATLSEMAHAQQQCWKQQCRRKHLCDTTIDSSYATISISGVDRTQQRQKRLIHNNIRGSLYTSLSKATMMEIFCTQYFPRLIVREDIDVGNGFYARMMEVVSMDWGCQFVTMVSKLQSLVECLQLIQSTRTTYWPL